MPCAERPRPAPTPRTWATARSCATWARLRSPAAPRATPPPTSCACRSLPAEDEDHTRREVRHHHLARGAAAGDLDVAHVAVLEAEDVVVAHRAVGQHAA